MSKNFRVAAVSADYNGKRTRKCVKCKRNISPEAFIIYAMHKSGPATASYRHYSSGWKMGSHHYGCFTVPKSITSISQVSNTQTLAEEDYDKLKVKIEKKVQKEIEKATEQKKKQEDEAAEEVALEEAAVERTAMAVDEGLVSDTDTFKDIDSEALGHLIDQEIIWSIPIDNSQPHVSKYARKFVTYTREELAKMKVSELRKVVSSAGLKSTGNVDAVIDRYLSYGSLNRSLHHQIEAKKKWQPDQSNDYYVFPDEFVLCVLSHCDAKTLCSASSVSRQFYRVSNDQSIWRNLCCELSNLDATAIELGEEVGWKEVYRQSVFGNCFMCNGNDFQYASFRKLANCSMCDSHYLGIFGSHDGKTSKTKIMSRINIDESDLDRLPLLFAPDKRMRLYDTRKGIRLQVFIYGSLEHAFWQEKKKLYKALKRYIDADHLPTGTYNSHHVPGMESEDLLYRCILEGYLDGDFMLNFTAESAAEYLSRQRRLKLQKAIAALDVKEIAQGIPEELHEELCVAALETGGADDFLQSGKNVDSVALSCLSEVCKQVRSDAVVDKYTKAVQGSILSSALTDNIALFMRLLPSVSAFVENGEGSVKSAIEQDVKTLAKAETLIESLKAASGEGFDEDEVETSITASPEVASYMRSEAGVTLKEACTAVLLIGASREAKKRKLKDSERAAKRKAVTAKRRKTKSKAPSRWS